MYNVAVSLSLLLAGRPICRASVRRGAGGGGGVRRFKGQVRGGCAPAAPRADLSGLLRTSGYNI